MPTTVQTRDHSTDLAYQLTGSIRADAVIRICSAEVTVWWREVPPLAGERPGVIGQFSAVHADDALAVLREACRMLRNAGCTVALGPMDGNTWRSYRFVTWRGSEPRFMLEPDQPDAWPGWWQDAGFAPREHYWSAVYQHLERYDLRLDATAARLHRAGVKLLPLRHDDFAGELARIHAVSCAAFSRNVLFAPMPLEAFSAMYQRLRPLIGSGFSFIAEHQDQPVGFIFALPDAEQAQRGEAIDTLVVKTLAVLPDRIYAGLGKLLLERSQQAAHLQRFRRVILALMHQDSRSSNLRTDAQVIRRYALFAKRLS